MTDDRIKTQFFRRSVRAGRIESDAGDDTTRSIPPRRDTDLDEEVTPPGATRTRRRRTISSSDIKGGDGKVDPILARLIHSSWNNFFSLFRPDELAMEFPRYQEEANDILAALSELGRADYPSLLTCKQIMFLLSRFSRERFQDLNARIDELANQSRQLASELEAHRLSSVVNEDELNRAQDVLNKTAQRLQVSVDAEAGNGPQKAVNLAEEVARNVNRDRQVLRILANQLGPEVWERLPVEVYLHLDQFREDEDDPADATRRR